MPHTFQAVIEQSGKTATGIPVPAEIVEALGKGKKPPVTVTIGGHTYRSTVAVYGGKFMLPLSAEHRGKAGVAGGDTVEVTLELDTAERTIDVPTPLAAALDSAGVRPAFDALSFSRRRQLIEPVVAAKTDETRERRIAAAVAAAS